MSDDKETKKAPATDTVEVHAQALNVPTWQLAGVRARHGWPEGKQITRADFKGALNEWLNGPTVGGLQ